MAYNEKAILKDVNGKPIPQYWNPETNQYEVITGKDGMIRVITNIKGGYVK
ncbi:MAG: mitochondrial small ribosomal subunit protein uS9m [Tissierellia bacterium]|nr:mitochondrial small ribosomal subunit protein uS9m [Tissierellia bacterium]